MSIDARVHRRFLDYLDLHMYFSRKTLGDVPLSMSAFAEKDALYAALTAKGEARDDEEEALYAALTNELHRN